MCKMLLNFGFSTQNIFDIYECSLWFQTLLKMASKHKLSGAERGGEKIFN